jgi:hypothetical protein
MLRRYYLMQLRLGRTSDGFTPAVGTAEGVVVARTTEPQPVPFFAQEDAVDIGWPTRGVAVRALDDPANPFRSEYGQLDRAHYAAGYFDYHLLSCTFSDDLVDRDGFVLPRARVWRQRLAAEQQYDWRQANLHDLRETSHTNEDQPTLKAFLAVHAPAPPPWLRDAAVRSWIPLPDGTLLINGPVLKTPEQRNRLSRALGIGVISLAWSHYSAEGRQLDDDAVGRFFAPRNAAGQIHTMQESVHPGEEMVVSQAGFTLVYAPTGEDTGELSRDYKLTDAFDWDGKVLDLKQPLVRPGGWCREYRMDISRTWNEQQAAALELVREQLGPLAVE